MLYSANDVVDWDVNQFDKKSDEAHDSKTDACGDSNLLELFSVWLCAPLDQPDGVLAELPHGLDVLGDLIHI